MGRKGLKASKAIQWARLGSFLGQFWTWGLMFDTLDLCDTTLKLDAICWSFLQFLRNSFTLILQTLQLIKCKTAFPVRNGHT